MIILPSLSFKWGLFFVNAKKVRFGRRFLDRGFLPLTHPLCSAMFGYVREGNHDNEKIYGDTHFSL
jgi:hypothetical protein